MKKVEKLSLNKYKWRGWFKVLNKDDRLNLMVDYQKILRFFKYSWMLLIGSIYFNNYLLNEFSRHLYPFLLSSNRSQENLRVYFSLITRKKRGVPIPISSGTQKFWHLNYGSISRSFFKTSRRFLIDAQRSDFIIGGNYFDNWSIHLTQHWNLKECSSNSLIRLDQIEILVHICEMNFFSLFF